ncbi:helicase-related protein [Empedobacter falsenii]
MILDNSKDKHTVFEWIQKYNNNGELDIVSGYFTIGALAWLSDNLNQTQNKFRFVFGDIVENNMKTSRVVDLLNENITIDAALKLNAAAKTCVDFLKQDKVICKTLTPNFCHAKAYLFKDENNDALNYYITGSSNLTEPGIGLKHTNNIELNIGETGNNLNFKELIEWFEELWNSKQASSEKLIEKDNKKTKKPFKQYLIDEIQSIYIEYTPKDLYYKVLFELFNEDFEDIDSNPEFKKQFHRLENTVIYNTLFNFQQKGVISLIKMLEAHNGAILADAVGLGKTWSALAVMKYYQEKREVILLSPKKLENNWRRYIKGHSSKFEDDKLDYKLFFHTDLTEERMDRIESFDYNFITNKTPKLLVIDESHNLRNNKSNRYKFLLEEIIKKNVDIKILLLSATPINNSLMDIRNQFNLIAKGENDFFKETLEVNNLEATFRQAQMAFNTWKEHENRNVVQLIKELPQSLFFLTDALIVARTRNLIKGFENVLKFPLKLPPQNHYSTPELFGENTFQNLLDFLPKRFSGYMPSFYLPQEEGVSVLHDEKQREFFLVKMMYILVFKRLESSWYSFSKTIENIHSHHSNVLHLIQAYDVSKKGAIDDFRNLQTDDDEIDDLISDAFEIGKKRKIKLSEIDKAGMLDVFKKHLIEDIKALQNIIDQTNLFKDKFNEEDGKKFVPSIDSKLEILMNIIKQKQSLSENNNNKKVIIFTVYHDTANYLFNQLTNRGFSKIGLVTGSVAKTSYDNIETKDFENILERFAPFTKVYNEKQWDFKTETERHLAFDEWKSWLKIEHNKDYRKAFDEPIEILIATDALSEGQNLQDADMVINYDIHWNPVRIIQRMGRIDRLGSPNDKIFGVNFWPSGDVNAYLNLQSRIESRMTAMTLAGAEVDVNFTDGTKDIFGDDDTIESKLKDNLLVQLENSLEDLDGDKNFGFDDLSLERFRQDLWTELANEREKYSKIPNAVYTGFIADKSNLAENGIIALLGYPAKKPKVDHHKYKQFELIYIDNQGAECINNQKQILDFLDTYKNNPRIVNNKIDNGDEAEIKVLKNAFDTWMSTKTTKTVVNEAGEQIKTVSNSLLDKIKGLGNAKKKDINEVKEANSFDEKYQTDNFDLITWFITTK